MDKIYTGGGGAKDYAISAIRFISFLMIFSCHILQYMEAGLADWLNVGVQIFLCISGYLYGGKTIDDTVLFLKRQFRKLLVSFYIVAVGVIAVQGLVCPEQLSPIMIIRTLLVNTTLRGGEHLWFIPTIMMCYVLTPLLQKLCDCFDHRRGRGTIFIGASIAITFGVFVRSYNFVWIICYVAGYTLRRWDLRPVKILIMAYSSANIAQVYFDYVLQVSFEGTAQVVYSYWCNLNHAALGITVFLILRYVLHDKASRACRFLAFTDRYTYEAYLVHQFMILGPLSLMKLTGLLPLNILIILFLTIILAVAVKRMSIKLGHRLC